MRIMLTMTFKPFFNHKCLVLGARSDVALILLLCFSIFNVNSAVKPWATFPFRKVTMV